MSKADLGVRMSSGDSTGGDLLKTCVEKGILGRKSGKGFYLYPKDAKKGAPKQLNPEMVKLIKSLRPAPPATVSKEDIQMRYITRGRCGTFLSLGVGHCMILFPIHHVARPLLKMVVVLILANS